VSPDVPLQLRCTCGRDECDTVLVVRLSDFDRVRFHSNRFVVARGHEPKAGTVVEEHEHYAVIEVLEQLARV
jgi:hypothetical protein